MSLDLPPWLRSVAHYVVGVWPSADEDALRVLAGVYEAAALEAQGLVESLAWQSSSVPGWEGDARQAHDAMVERVLRKSGLADVVSAAAGIAAGVRETAAQVEKAKYEAIIILAWLVASIAWAWAMAPWTGGASLGWLAAAEALAQRLLGEVGQWLVRAVVAAGTGAAFMMSADGLSQAIVIAEGHSDRFDVKSFLVSAGMGAAAGMVGLGVMSALAKGEVAAREALTGGEAGDKLVLPVWSMSMPGQIAEQAGISVGTGTVFQEAQGTGSTDVAGLAGQGVAAGLAGGRGAHTAAGGAPKGLAEALDRLTADGGGGGFGPFEAIPDSGEGFSLPGGQWLEVTSGGAWWARSQDVGGVSAGAAFGSAVRGMGAGQDGRPRLVVGTPYMPSGGAVQRLETVWGAVQRPPGGLPQEIVLATPVSPDELAGLQDFVAAHGVSVSAPIGRVLAAVDGALFVTAGGTHTATAAAPAAVQWLHITPSDEPTGRTVTALSGTPTPSARSVPVGAAPVVADRTVTLTGQQSVVLGPATNRSATAPTTVTRTVPHAPTEQNTGSATTSAGKGGRAGGGVATSTATTSTSTGTAGTGATTRTAGSGAQVQAHAQPSGGQAATSVPQTVSGYGRSDASTADLGIVSSAQTNPSRTGVAAKHAPADTVRPVDRLEEGVVDDEFGGVLDPTTLSGPRPNLLSAVLAGAGKDGVPVQISADVSGDAVFPPTVPSKALSGHEADSVPTSGSETGIDGGRSKLPVTALHQEIPTEFAQPPGQITRADLHVNPADQVTHSRLELASLARVIGIHKEEWYGKFFSRLTAVTTEEVERAGEIVRAGQYLYGSGRNVSIEQLTAIRRAADVLIKQYSHTGPFRLNALDPLVRDVLKLGDGIPVTLEQRARLIDLVPHAKAKGRPLTATALARAAWGASSNTAKDNARWWSGHSDDGHRRFLQFDPALVGRLDGLPSRVRDSANRRMLNDLQKSLRDRQSTVAARLERSQDPVGRAVYGRKLAQVGRELAILARLSDQLRADGERAHRYLLGFGTEGSGHVIVAVGDPDTAQNVVVYVPGTGTNLPLIGVDIDRAIALHSEVMNRYPGSSVASIMWMGYKAPQSLVQAAFPGLAVDGALKLNDFLRGLKESHQGEVSRNMTLLGHSYGSLVAGKALAADQLTPVDNVIFVGSPGVGVDHARDLHLEPSRVWAGKSPNDLIKVATIPNPRDPSSGSLKSFGIDPVSRKFGGNRFDVARTKTGPWDAHRLYWDEGSISLQAMADIVTGNPVLQRKIV
ncbi:alpha/beta hydrolase [Kitasatospora sp. NBC_00240]|uniref:alpha/beta hydrolase n=1 Tax=Kitasatospora sp. NBC_00240 TaxID=2903567 RepID=UPI00225AC131|nr:alpha/beta hydrolase [Kitasatospora sp. NBC_00240]MCX5215560.1 alpha/beta hydrolase [Kitasatospora sp. NBC_00240]